MKMSVFRGFPIHRDGACRWWIDTGPEGKDYGYFNNEQACEEHIDLVLAWEAELAEAAAIEAEMEEAQ